MRRVHARLLAAVNTVAWRARARVGVVDPEEDAEDGEEGFFWLLLQPKSQSQKSDGDDGEGA